MKLVRILRMRRSELQKRALGALGGDLAPWAHRCHEAALALVKAGIGDRVARGWCARVSGQHSWAVVGSNCYDPRATIIDPTLWSYDDEVRGIYVGTWRGHRPHGHGSIWSWGRPANAAPGEAVALRPARPLTAIAAAFVEALGPLGRDGWALLATHAPVGGWPAGELLSAIADTPELGPALVPIDRLGMLTDRNPGGLYMRSEEP